MIWYVDRHCNRAVILQYPDAWGATPETDFWFDDNYIGDRARLVHEIVRAQKPYFRARTSQRDCDGIDLSGWKSHNGYLFPCSSPCHHTGLLKICNPQQSVYILMATWTSA